MKIRTVLFLAVVVLGLSVPASAAPITFEMRATVAWTSDPQHYLPVALNDQVIFTYTFEPSASPDPLSGTYFPPGTTGYRWTLDQPTYFGVNGTTSVVGSTSIDSYFNPTTAVGSCGASQWCYGVSAVVERTGSRATTISYVQYSPAGDFPGGILPVTPPYRTPDGIYTYSFMYRSYDMDPMNMFWSEAFLAIDSVSVVAGGGPGEDPAPVPEPATLLLLGSGLVAAYKARKRH